MKDEGKALIRRDDEDSCPPVERERFFLPAILDDLVDHGRAPVELQRRLVIHRILHGLAAFFRRRLPARDGAILWFLAALCGAVATALFGGWVPMVPVAVALGLLGASLFATGVDVLVPRQIRTALGKGFLVWRLGRGSAGDGRGHWRLVVGDEAEGRLHVHGGAKGNAIEKVSLPLHGIEELELQALGPPTTGDPDPVHRIIARGAGRSVVLAEGRDLDRLLPLASFLGQKLHRRLVDRTSPRSMVFEPDELDRPSYVSLAAVLDGRDGGGWAPAADATGAEGLSLRGRAARARSFEIRALHFLMARVVPSIGALASVVAFTILVSGVGGSVSATVMLILSLLATVVPFLLGSAMPLRTRLEVNPTSLSASEGWFGLERPLFDLPWQEILRIVPGPEGLTLVDRTGERRLSVEDGVDARRRIEGILLERHGVFSPGNLFRRLRDLSEDRERKEEADGRKSPGRARILGSLHGRRLVLTVAARGHREEDRLQDVMRHAPDPLALWEETFRRDELWQSWCAGQREVLERVRASDQIYTTLQELRTAFGQLDRALESAPPPIELGEDRFWAAEIVLHGDALRAGSSFEVFLAPRGWAGLLAERGWQAGPRPHIHLKGDVEPFRRRHEADPQLAAALDRLFDDLPASRLRVDPNRVSWSAGSLTVPTRAMSPLVDAMERLLLVARGETRPAGEDVDPEAMSFRLEGASESRCNLCGDAVALDEAHLCPRCETPHHRECWDWNGGCTVYACPERPVEDEQDRR